MIRPALRRLEAHQQAGLDLRPRPVELGFAQRCRGLGKHLAGKSDGFGGTIALGRTADPDHSDIVEGMAPGIDRISEAALFTQLLKQPRRSPAAERLNE